MTVTEQLVLELIRKNGQLPVTEAPHDRRKDERRVLCRRLSVSIWPEGAARLVPGYVVSISKSGLGLWAKEHLLVGARIRIEMSTVLVTGTVRYCNHAPRDGHFHLGIQIGEFGRTH